MSNSNLATSPDSQATPENAPIAPAPNRPWVWPLMLALGALAGGVGAEAIDATRELYQVPAERLGMPPHPPEIEREMWHNALLNHAIGFSLLGGLLGVVISFATGCLARSVQRGMLAALVGGLLGVMVGAAGGMAAISIYDGLADVQIDGLFKAILIHLPNWLLLGTALGITSILALPDPMGRGQRAFSFVTAGILAAVLYPLVSLVIFPAAASDRPAPFDLGPRLLCFAFGGLVLGVAAARALRSGSTPVVRTNQPE